MRLMTREQSKKRLRSDHSVLLFHSQSPTLISPLQVSLSATEELIIARIDSRSPANCAALSLPEVEQKFTEASSDNQVWYVCFIRPGDTAVKAADVVAVMFIEVAALVADDGDFFDMVEMVLLVGEGAHEVQVKGLAYPGSFSAVPADTVRTISVRLKEEAECELTRAYGIP